MRFLYTIRASDGRVFPDLAEDAYLELAEQLIAAGLELRVSSVRDPSKLIAVKKSEVQPILVTKA